MRCSVHGGRAKKAVHLHAVERQVRKITAELNEIKCRKSVTNVNVQSGCVGACGVEVMLIKNDKDIESCFADAIVHWERKMCREEGVMMKGIREGAIKP